MSIDIANCGVCGKFIPCEHIRWKTASDRAREQRRLAARLVALEVVTAPIVFCDTETTGLDPDAHEVFEVGLIYEVNGLWSEVTLWLGVDLTKASPDAARFTKYHERLDKMGSITTEHKQNYSWAKWGDDAKWTGFSHRAAADLIALVTAGKHMVGAVPSFDAAFLTRFLRRYGQVPAWHYHLVDVEALAAGALGVEPPWDSEGLSRGVGVNPDAFERHTALADARWAKAVYEAALAHKRASTKDDA